MKKSEHSDSKSAISMCESVIEDAQDIINTINMKDLDDLPVWWTNKLAISYAYLNSLRDYIVFKVEDDSFEEDDTEESEESEEFETDDDIEDSEENNLDTSGQIRVGDYTTKHFDICPSAQKLYSNIIGKTDMIHLVVESMMLQDMLFRLEKQAIAMGSIDQDMVDKAQHYVDMIMDLAIEMRLETEHRYLEEVHMAKFKDLASAETIQDDMLPPSARMVMNAS